MAYLKPRSPEFQIQSLHPKLLSAYILYSLHAINYCQRTSHCDMHLHNLSVCKGRERCLVFLCLFIRFKTLSDLHLLACLPCLYVSHMWCTATLSWHVESVQILWLYCSHGSICLAVNKLRSHPTVTKCHNPYLTSGITLTLSSSKTQSWARCCYDG